MGLMPRLDCYAERQTTPRPRRRRGGSWAIGLVALGSFGLLLAACGGGSNKTTASPAASQATTTPTTATNGNRTAQRQAFNQCMQSHGVNSTNLRGLGGFRGGGNGPSDSTTGTGPTTTFTLPPGVTQAQLQAALQACRSLLPSGGNFQNNPAFAAYRNCLQLHGVTLGTGQGQGQGLNQTNPTVQAAMQACAALRPRPSSTTSTAPPTT
jgi:hypothetical protein